MGNSINTIPVTSQAKSLVQVMQGDVHGARHTQLQFAYNNTFPVISQIASLGYAADGKHQEAPDLQKKFAKEMEEVLDNIPIAEHVKGTVHFAMGDNQREKESMKAASRSTAVVAGAATGLLIGGPPGAVEGGVAGGLAADAIITASEVAAKGKNAKPYGMAEVFEYAAACDGDPECADHAILAAQIIVA